ncbi:MAG TPA: DinB family protein [Puia sp.]|nr:DinB family protein [Puia sp.]
MDMIQFSSENLSVLFLRGQENYSSRSPVSANALRDDCNRYFIRKSLFKSTMKEIARNLEKTLMDFLHTDLLSKNWTYKAGPNKWSKKEIIGHLIDSAQINLQRFVRSTYSENFTLTYDQVEWVDAQQYISADIEELLELWRLLNRQIIRVLENYPTHRLQIQSDTGKTAVCFHTVEHLAQDYVNHLNHHLKAIELV